jgi:type II secretory pathway pseudopilin PulG
MFRRVIGKWRLGRAMKGNHTMKISHRSSNRECRARGFSLLEMMIVICVLMIVGGIGFMALQPALKDAKVNQAFESAMMPLRVARQRAIAERKQYIVCYGIAAPAGAVTPIAPTAQSIQTFRWDAGTALSAATQITAVTLPIDIQFQALPGLPNAPATVPDGFGIGATAIDFDQGVAGGGIKNQVLFMPDGSAHDVNGNLNSGIVYVARNGDLYSSRAITLYGATGRIRGWRLLRNGAAPRWFQQ